MEELRRSPPGMYKNLVNSGINDHPQLVNAGFLNHQQYDRCFNQKCLKIKEQKLSADPSRRVVAIILCKIQTVPKIQNPKSEIRNPKSKIQDPKSKIQNPKSKIQDPKSKIQTAAFGAATKRTDTTTIQNPKSKIQGPKSKIQNPKSKIQNPKSKIQDPKSKLQNPKSKRPVWILDFGVWIWVAGLAWLCSKRSCVDGLATQIWRSW